MPPLNEGDMMFMPIADPSIRPGAKHGVREASGRGPEEVSGSRLRGREGRARRHLDRSGSAQHDRDHRAFEAARAVAARHDAREAQERDGPRGFASRCREHLDQPIINRIDMLTTGIRSEIGVKIFGTDLTVLEGKAREIADAVRTVPGASDVYPEQVTGGLYLDIRPNREAAARYGIDIGEIQDVIETAIGENNLTTTIEGRQRFPVRVRYAPQYRRDPQDARQRPGDRVHGAQIPLGQVADIRQVSGPAMINSENGLLVVSVLLNARGRDLGSVIVDAEKAIRDKITLPPGYYYGWSGQFENEVRARKRLQIVMPIVIAVIYILLFLTYRSFLEAAHVLLAVPFALTGGVYLLWLLGYNFSVAVWVGFIALFGTAVQTTVVMVIYLEEAVARKRKEHGTLTIPISAMR